MPLGYRPLHDAADSLAYPLGRFVAHVPDRHERRQDVGRGDLRYRPAPERGVDVRRQRRLPLLRVLVGLPAGAMQLDHFAGRLPEARYAGPCDRRIATRPGNRDVRPGRLPRLGEIDGRVRSEPDVSLAASRGS